MLFKGLPVRMGIATGLSEGRQVPLPVAPHICTCCAMLYPVPCAVEVHISSCSGAAPAG